MNLSNLFKKKPWLLVVALTLIVIVAMSSFRLPLTIMGVNRVFIEQTGSDVPTTPEWEGGFWVINGLADMVESYLLFDSSVSNISGEDYLSGNKLVPTASLKITIKPDTPYWTLPVTPKSLMVYPDVYSTWFNAISKAAGRMTEKIASLSVPVWVADPQMQGSWQLHTPFWFTVEKLNGPNAFSETQYFDTVGGKQELVIINPGDSDEQLKVARLGELTTGLTQPLYTYIVIFDKNTAFEWDAAIELDIAYDTNIGTGARINDWSYSQYWFGGGPNFPEYSGTGQALWVSRWKDIKSPTNAIYDNEISPIDPIGLVGLVDDKSYPGNKIVQIDSTTWKSVPVAADVFNNVLGTNPSGLSLVNYLVASTVSRCTGYGGVTGTVAKPADRIHALVNLNAFNLGAEIDATNNMLKVYAPYGSSSSFYQFKISTELVDTLIYQEPSVDAAITQVFWGSTGTSDKVTIGDQDVAHYVVKNLGTVEATISIEVSGGTAPIQILPASLQQQSISSDGTFDFEFGIKNTNAGTETVEGTLTATVKSAGVVRDTDSTLTMSLPPRTQAETILPVKTVDYYTGTAIAGIDVTMNFGTISKQGTTNTDGVTTFYFQQSYDGGVTLISTETPIYQAKMATLTVTSGLNPTYYLRLLKHGETVFDWSLLLPWVLLTGVIIPTAFFIYKKRRKLF